jgi:hypothetical protein
LAETKVSGRVVSKDHAPPNRALAGDDVSRLFQGRDEADSFVGAATAVSADP